MKNFIADLLIKLAEKEEEAKDLAVQVKALEIIVTALLQNLDDHQKVKFITRVESCLAGLASDASAEEYDSSEISKSLARLLFIQNEQLIPLS